MRRRRRNLLKQKLCGIAFVAIGFVPIIICHDATVGVILIPAGAYLTGTRRMIMDFD